HALAAILTSMRSPDGKIMVEGFYDGVRPLTDAERADIAQVPFDEQECLAGVGVTEGVGEPGYLLLERLWTRPTLDVNGIWGGVQGERTKTVLAAAAHAKTTCRLVPDQEPAQVLDASEAHVHAHTPPAVKVQVTKFPGSSPAYLMERDHPILDKAAQALR